MKPSKKSWSGSSILVLFVVGLLAALGIFLYIRYLKKKKQEQATTEEEQPADTTGPVEAQPDALLNFYKGVKQIMAETNNEDDNRAALLTAQAAFETGEFTSEILVGNNNAFGMRQPKVRDTTSLGDKNGYASYASIDDSIRDRLLWDDYNKVSYEGATVTSFVQGLNKLSYFEDSFLNYKNGVNLYMKKLQAEISRG